MKFLNTVLGLAAVYLASATEQSHVHQLTQDNFDTFIKENPISLVKFYAPWCGHCKKLAPEYEAAAEKLKSMDSIPLAEVDATVHKDLSRKYEIQGFPTLFLFRDGKPENYSGGRSSQQIIDWVQKMTGPAVEWVERSAIPELANKHPVLFAASVPSKTSEKATIYDSVASSMRTEGKFVAYIADAEPTVIVYHAGEPPVNTTIKSATDLEKFVASEAFPLLGPITGENYSKYNARSKQWVWVAATNEDYQKHGSGIRKVSKNYRDEFNFVWLDLDQLKHHAESALGLKEFPAVAVIYDNQKYHLYGEITEKTLTKFLESVKAGKVAVFRRTEPVPEDNSKPVKIVVGSQFSEMVFRDDKDVFLKVHAPWCGHCKRLSPVWDELAESTDDIVVAKMDGTANEPDVEGFEFQGFPTLFFVKAGTKTPILYDGDRNLKSLLEFVKQHATKPIRVKGDTDEEVKDEL